MFENKKTKKHGVHYSRYIASWLRKRGRLIEGDFIEYDDYGNCGRFAKWLRSIGLDEDEISDICRMAQCGQIGLEMSAERFIKNGI